MKEFTKIIITLLLILGGLLCIWIIYTGDLTARESSLVGVLLSILSILGSWLVTHIYSESEHQKAIEQVQEFHRNNLQTYAKKAAEKVNNLSTELGKLATYIADELSRNDSDDRNETLLSREERMASVIHIVNTLKSVNDTALSDWEGVIDDLLEQQKEEKHEREEEFYELVQRLEPILENELSDPNTFVSEADTLRTEVNEIRKDLKSLVVNMGISNIPIRTTKKKLKKDIENKCPICSKIVSYQQRPLKNSFKPVKCKGCESKLISSYNIDVEKFILAKRELVKSKISCPQCGSECDAYIDSLPNAFVIVSCEKCHNSFKVTQKVTGDLSIKNSTNPSKKVELTEELLTSIKENLPAQPWQRGAHREVAKILNISPGVAWRGTETLIRRGDFKPQYDGVLYDPEPVMSEEKTPQQGV